MKASPALFKNQKSALIFKRMALVMSIWVKFSIQNVILRVSRKKSPKSFPLVSLFLVFLTICLSKCFTLTNLSPPPLPLWHEKFLVTHPHTGIILFAKCCILNVRQCSEYVCLDNCSIICTMTLCYLLHQTYSEFWHIQRSVFYMPAYSNIFSFIETYSHIVKAYSDLFRHIQHPV